MKINSSLAPVLGVPALLCATAAHAEFSWEGEIELGNEQVVSSDVAANEIRDTYLVVTATGTYSFGNGVEFFSTLTAESVIDPVADRTFEDIGLYVEEIGFSFGIGEATTVTIGKLHPVFGTAWDDAAGFFGSSLAEDYELAEQIGVLADVELEGAGTLSFGLFYADDTGLSRSWGEDRGRNRASAGGAGNTGELDNFAIQWAYNVGETRFHIGARHLSASVGDVDDEQGIVAGIGHSFAGGVDVFAEVASFSNFGGGVDDATFVTLNAAYGTGPWSFSGTLAQRDLETAGETDLVSIGVDYEFQSGVALSGALARVEDTGVEDTILGLSVVIPLGG
ncbi:porin [Phaeobacter sp. QD34_3]|uniref:porin n=1 Tax=unclassified Phaeobacter TaxID=2621772 RepID=UPI00237F0F45|nr:MULTISPECIES: porin [unclassified Phaeobacter]MDE4133836.1 porin [Phaeobacter sp. QD34_3]MDE4137473.1 porin [Phaeobacter sp. QD34_24]MDE4174936.1 porin [Phaeobacter sp. PT47_59]